MPDRAKYLARQTRYNTSLKGKQRYKRYETKHPERATRWAPIMAVKARLTRSPESFT